jgi:hypothetical protein
MSICRSVSEGLDERSAQLGQLGVQLLIHLFVGELPYRFVDTNVHICSAIDLYRSGVDTAACSPGTHR